MKTASAAAALALIVLDRERDANAYALGKLIETDSINFVVRVGIASQGIADRFGIDAQSLTHATLNILRSPHNRIALEEQDAVRRWLEQPV